MSPKPSNTARWTGSCGRRTRPNGWPQRLTQAARSATLSANDCESKSMRVPEEIVPYQFGWVSRLDALVALLWFVILFIPVIPLGRKRIIDRCPACSRHYVIDLRKWETAKQLEISGALEKFRSNPAPDTAIEAHRQLLAYQQPAEAAELQKAMGEKFPDNVRVQAYLGAALTHLGKFTDAEPFFARALELRPDLPEARVGVACAHIRAKRLDEARRLVDFLEKPGAGQLYSLSPLEQLALAYQQAARHTEALALFGRL